LSVRLFRYCRRPKTSTAAEVGDAGSKVPFAFRNETFGLNQALQEKSAVWNISPVKPLKPGSPC